MGKPNIVPCGGKITIYVAESMTLNGGNLGWEITIVHETLQEQ